MTKTRTPLAPFAAASAAGLLLIVATLPAPTLSDAPPNPNPVKLHIKPGAADASRRHLGGDIEQVLKVQLKGTAEYSWYETMSGHTVQVSKADGRPHYMDVDDDTGALYETDCIVGECNPDTYGIYPHAVDDEEQILYKAGPAARRDRRIRLNPVIKRFKDRKKLRAKKANGSDGKRKLRGGDATTTRPSNVDDRALLSTGGSDYSDMTMNNLVLLIRWADHKDRKLPSKEDMEM